MLENEKKKCYAIVLSAGTGSRMGSSVPKQYLPLLDRPVMKYCWWRERMIYLM